jgi:hypothetical protein
MGKNVLKCQNPKCGYEEECASDVATMTCPNCTLDMRRVQPSPSATGTFAAPKKAEP